MDKNCFGNHYGLCRALSGILVVLIACAPILLQGQTSWIKLPEHKGPVRLSGSAAVIAANHFAAVMRLLKDGGPHPGLSETEAARWSVEDEIQRNGLSGRYSKEQYLADYRAEFIKEWRAQIEEYVEEAPKGTFRMRRGSSYHSHGIPNRGGSNGYWDAVAIVEELKKRTDQEQWSSDDGNAETEHPTAAFDAFLWIYQTEKGEKERPRATGLKMMPSRNHGTDEGSIKKNESDLPPSNGGREN
jgi:hypothetical protein